MKLEFIPMEHHKFKIGDMVIGKPFNKDPEYFMHVDMIEDSGNPVLVGCMFIDNKGLRRHWWFTENDLRRG